MIDDAFRERMNVIIGLAGSIAALSRSSALSRGVIEKYRDGESDPSRRRLVALANAAGVNLLWLATGDGPMRPGDPARYEASPESPPARPLDHDLLQALLELYLERSKARGMELSPAQIAEAVTRLYAETEAELTSGQLDMKAAG